MAFRNVCSRSWSGFSWRGGCDNRGGPGSRESARVGRRRSRRLGLPVTSALTESLVKEVNNRVKGTEMFWNDPEGAEAILQVRAAALRDDDRLVATYALGGGVPASAAPPPPPPPETDAEALLSQPGESLDLPGR